MKFGVGYFTAQRPPNDRRPFAEIYRDMLAHGRLIDKHRLDSFWVVEHHFCDDGYLASPVSVAAAVLGSTDHLMVGIGLAAASHQPLRMAEDLIALDLIAPGRVQLHLSAGYIKHEYAGFGVDYETRADRYAETIEIVTRAFAGQPFSFEGRHHHVSPLTVTPPPATPGGPRLVFSGGSVDAARRAAKLGGIYKVDASIGWEDSKKLVEAYDAAGGDPQALHVQVYGFIDPAGPEAAWAKAVDGFIYMRETYDSWGWAPFKPASRDPKDYRLLLGDVDEVAAQVGQYRAEFGDRLHLTLRLSYPGMPADQVSQAIELWADVAGRFR
jgi:alkanesulfonate monooxygenase SsuD/methylene tetrahydromethanopterin reductase-like flavin-dependent oxidoreductase (luciferase family)